MNREYPGRRFQAGSQVADRLEALAVDRAKEVFGAEHANVQPYSGSTANYSVYSTVLKPGDTVLSMRLDQGGHLTHGRPVNFLSSVYNFVFYGVCPETEIIDYDEVVRLAAVTKPKLLVAGASSYPRLIDYERLKSIAASADALLMVDMAHIAGLVVARVIPSPVPQADFVSSSTAKTFCSARGGLVLCKAEHAEKLDKGVFPWTISSIHLLIIAAKAFYLKQAGSQKCRIVMERVLRNAKALVAALTERGFRIVAGGTDTQMVLADLHPKDITGRQLQEALEYVGITVNKNMIPFDPAKPAETSGVRIGLTFVSQRGMEEEQIHMVADIIGRVADRVGDENILNQCRKESEKLIAEFPLYPEFPKTSVNLVRNDGVRPSVRLQ